MSEHLKYPTEGHGAIPSFKSYQEEADWWDTHDTGEDEIQAEFHPMSVRFAKNLSEAFKVRFDPETVMKLRKRAHAKGIGPTTLIRMLVIEQLHHDEQTDEKQNASQGAASSSS